MSETLYIDELTGVYNRRYLNEHMRQQVASYIDGKIPLSVVMVDIDHFKDINDVHGHMKGDEVIYQFAQFLKESLRASDVVIRYGGDEFTCIMPEAAKLDAEAIHQRIARKCKDRSFGNLNITLSAGIASFPEDGEVFDELLSRADQALYDAKRSGRNRVGIIGVKRAEIPIKVFIDRLEEKEHIKKTLTEYGNKVRVALVRGIVGVGKTRLSKEVLGDLRGKEVIWSDCVYFEKALAYYAIRELIKYRIKRWGVTIFSDIPFVYQLEIGKLVPEVLDSIKDQIEPAAMVMDRYRLYESVRRVLEVGEREKVLIIDNIQWIDEESIEVLKYLIRAFRENPVTFILVQRTEELTETLDEFLGNISREFEMREIVLEPFKPPEIKEAIKAIIGEDPSPKLVKFISNESGGIPFYIEEIMRALIEQRNLYVEQNEWCFTEPERELIPRNLADIAIKKYRALTKEAQYILEIASAMGHFDLPVLQQITEFNEGHVLGLLSEISRIGVVKYVQDKYVFSAAISRNAIYDKFVKGFKAKALHCTIASIIESRNKGREDDVIDELALHYYLAHDKEKGVRYCISAGEKAREKYAHQDAIQYFTWASELLKSETDIQSIKQRIRCYLYMAKVLAFIGSTSTAVEYIEKALRVVEEHEDDNIRADILKQKTDVHLQMAQFDEVVDVGKQASFLFEKANREKEKAHLYCLIGRAYRRMGKFHRAMTMFKEALDIFDMVGEADEKAHALINIGNVNQDQGEYANALENYEKCLAIHQKQKERDGEARVLTNISNVYSRTGKIDEALSYVQKAAVIFKEVGDRINEARALNNTATILDTLGECDKGLSLYKQALKIHRDVGNRDGEALALLNMGALYSYTGDANKAQGVLAEALKIAKEIHSDIAHFYVLLNLCDICVDRKEYEKVESMLEEIFVLAEKNKRQREYALQLACDYYLKCKDFDRFNKAFDEFEKLSREINVPRIIATRSNLHGQYCLATGQYDKAFALLCEALKLYESVKERQMVAVTNYYLSRVEKAREHAEKEKEYLDKAIQQLSAIKAQRWLNIINKETE